jgi:hypothetical protein
MVSLVFASGTQETYGGGGEGGSVGGLEESQYRFNDRVS